VWKLALYWPFIMAVEDFCAAATPPVLSNMKAADICLGPAPGMFVPPVL
jgi:hypothetical protein